MKKDVEVTINGRMNTYEDFAVELDEFLDDEEIPEVLAEEDNIYNFEDRLEEYLAPMVRGKDLEITNIDHDEDGITVSCVSDYQIDAVVTITEDMTADEFLNEIARQNHTEAGDYIGFIDISVSRDDYHYPEGEYEYLDTDKDEEYTCLLDDEGAIRRDFEDFKRELLSYDEPKEKERSAEKEY